MECILFFCIGGAKPLLFHLSLPRKAFSLAENHFPSYFSCIYLEKMYSLPQNQLCRLPFSSRPLCFLGPKQTAAVPSVAET